MTDQERRKYCTICTHRKVDFSVGVICGLTDKKADFEDSCEHFVKDEKEMQRKLNIKLDAAGNARSQNSSLNPKANKQSGLALTIAGVIVFLFSMVFGVILITGGISLMIRGTQQQKILDENEEFNSKLNKE